MADIFRWGAIAFYVKPGGIRGVKDIEISGGCETEDSVVDAEKFVKKKNSEKYQVSLTAILDYQLGEDVQGTMLLITEAARNAEQGYIYTAGGKLLPFPFMLTEAKAGNIDMTSGGKWLHAEVKMTMKQCSKYDGTTLTGSGGDGSDKARKDKTIYTDQWLRDKKARSQAAIQANNAAKAQSRKIEEMLEIARQMMTGTVKKGGAKSVELPHRENFITK